MKNHKTDNQSCATALNATRRLHLQWI